MKLPARRTIIGILLFIPLAVLLLATYACLPAPVGDPDQSKTDDKFTGVWQTAPAKNADAKDDDINLVMLRPWDAHTYYLTYVATKKDAKEAATPMHFKAWLTKLGDATFITAEPIDDLSFAFGRPKDEKPTWVVGRVEIKDNALTLRLIKDDSWIVKGMDTREKLEAAIKAQADNAELYSDSTTWKKLSKDDAKTVEEALKGKPAAP